MICEKDGRWEADGGREEAEAAWSGEERGGGGRGRREGERERWMWEREGEGLRWRWEVEVGVKLREASGGRGLQVTKRG